MKSFLIIELDYNTPNETQNTVVDYEQYRIMIHILIYLSNLNPRDNRRIGDNSGFHT